MAVTWWDCTAAGIQWWSSMCCSVSNKSV